MMCILFTELQELHQQVHKEAQVWVQSLPNAHRMRIQQHMGCMPDVEAHPLGLADGPAWSWWLVAVLPLDPRAKLAIMAMTSLKERLLASRRVLTYIMRKANSQ